MPISRDARMDRRRRLLRDTAEGDSVESTAAPRRSSRRASPADEPVELSPKRKAGYSQDVRKACGQRLVQLIPVRRRSFAAVVSVSLLIPGLLIAAHYLIHVTGQLQWWRHPLAIALDIGHPRSIAAWLSSQLWLLCLGATVLTFQLRKHKLDDYTGEYRLWFWLVLTCLVASVDATTSITELFSLALDPWAQSQLGWSGPAIVDATLAVLIGMLGLRMCSELKVVPFSLVWWLAGLVAWAVSAALARPEFRLEMSAPHRYWLTATCWLGGLTLIWLAALTYLRTIYVEAQQRFLLRGRLASSGMLFGQCLRNSLPAMPRFRRTVEGQEELGGEAVQGAAVAPRWKLPGMPAFMRRRSQEQDPIGATVGKASAKTASGLGRRVRTNDASQADPSPQRESATTERLVAGGAGKAVQENSAEGHPSGGKKQPDSPGSKSGLGGWLRRAKDNDDAEEYRKVSSAKSNATVEQDTEAGEKPGRRWLPKLPRPKLPVARIPRPKLSLPKFSRSKAADSLAPPEKLAQTKTKEKRPGWLSRIKLPTVSLSALKLQPPSEQSDSTFPPQTPGRLKELQPVSNTARPLPGTQPVDDQEAYFEEDEQDGRQLSKAERKRLRRNQQPPRRSA